MHKYFTLLLIILVLDKLTGQFDFDLLSNMNSKDPIKRLEVINKFNGRSENPQRNTEKTFRLDSIVSRQPDINNPGLSTDVVRYYQFGENDKTSSLTFAQVTQPGQDTTGIIMETTVYNEFDQMSQVNILIWNSSTLTWIDYYRVEFEYNSDQLLSSIIIYFWDDSILAPDRKADFLYNTAQLPILITDHNWNDSLASWVENYKEEYTYSPFKELLSVITSYKDDSLLPWMLASKTNYSYGQGLVLSKNIFAWNTTFWENSERTLFTYDSKKNLIQQSDQIWLPPAPVWFDDRQYFYQYDAMDRRISSMDRRWFNDGHEWFFEDSTSFAYTPLDDTMEIKKYYWSNSLPQGWTPDTYSNRTYNTDVDFNSILWPMSLWEPITNSYHSMIIGAFNQGSDAVIMKGTSTYFYSMILATEEITIHPITIYPNPAVDQIQITLPELLTGNCADIEIYNMEGKCVIRKPTTFQLCLDIENLIPGVYSVLLHASNEYFTGKFTVQK